MKNRKVIAKPLNSRLTHSRYRVRKAAPLGELYKLEERRDKPHKRSRWKTIAIGTKRLYRVAEVLNSVNFE